MPKKKNRMQKAFLARVLLSSGAVRVSSAAVEEFAKVLEEKAVEIGKKASELAKHAGRKTVRAEDIRMALK